MIKKNYAQICFHSNRPHSDTITNMNGKMNMDSTIAGSININHIVGVMVRVQ